MVSLLIPGTSGLFEKYVCASNDVVARIRLLYLLTNSTAKKTTLTTPSETPAPIAAFVLDDKLELFVEGTRGEEVGGMIVLVGRDVMAVTVLNAVNNVDEVL